MQQIIVEYLVDLYVVPRMSVVPGHEHKACKSTPTRSKSHLLTRLSVIPYRNLFNFNPDPSAEPLPADHPHIILQVVVSGITAHSVKIDCSFPQHGFDMPEILFAYAVYGLGSHLPAPINLWAKESVSELQLEGEHVKERTEEEGDEVYVEYRGMKVEGIARMRRCQKRIEKADSVLVVGGGALGVRESPSCVQCPEFSKPFRVCNGHPVLVSDKASLVATFPVSLTTPI